LRTKKYQTKTFNEGLNSIDFGFPQKRKRVFAISIYSGDINKNSKSIANLIEEICKCIDDQKIPINKELLHKKLFKIVDSSSKKYPKEYREIRLTPSRKIMIEKNPIYINSDPNVFACPTITTKQDRNPNCGFVKYKNGYRFLTPRELYQLMGFNNNDVDKMYSDIYQINNQIREKQAGNSIVVKVLEEIFKGILSRGKYE